MEASVVNSVLSIAGFTTGVLLGIFILGLRKARVSESAALFGLTFGIIITGFAAFGTSLAWPWYAIVASGSTVFAGLAADRLLPGR